MFGVCILPDSVQYRNLLWDIPKMLCYCFNPFQWPGNFQHSCFDTQIALPHSRVKFASLTLPLLKGPSFVSLCNTFQPSINSYYAFLKSFILSPFAPSSNPISLLEECPIYIMASRMAQMSLSTVWPSGGRTTVWFWIIHLLPIQPKCYHI